MSRCMDEMSVFELSRWYAIVDAVNIIGDECDERGIKFNDVKLSPLVIEKYIESTCDIFAQKIIDEKNNKERNHIDVNIIELNEDDGFQISIQELIERCDHEMAKDAESVSCSS